MTPEDAYGILEVMAEIHGLSDRLKKYEMNDAEKNDERMAQEIKANGLMISDID